MDQRGIELRGDGQVSLRARALGATTRVHHLAHDRDRVVTHVRLVQLPAHVPGQQPARRKVLRQPALEAAQDQPEHVERDWTNQPRVLLDLARFLQHFGSQLRPQPEARAFEERGRGRLGERPDLAPVVTLAQERQVELVERAEVIAPEDQKRGHVRDRPLDQVVQECLELRPPLRLVQNDELLELVEDDQKPRLGAQISGGALEPRPRVGRQIGRRLLPDRAGLAQPGGELGQWVAVAPHDQRLVGGLLPLQLRQHPCVQDGALAGAGTAGQVEDRACGHPNPTKNLVVRPIRSRVALLVPSLVRPDAKILGVLKRPTNPLLDQLPVAPKLQPSG